VHIKFAELPVFNQDRAKEFYTEHFGCQLVVDQAMSLGGWRWIERRFPGTETTLHFLQRSDEEPSKGSVMGVGRWPGRGDRFESAVKGCEDHQSTPRAVVTGSGDHGVLGQCYRMVITSR
jgi:catechol 2,3-dioxygenase-like lactoylglutathione lyase family enzyme